MEKYLAVATTEEGATAMLVALMVGAILGFMIAKTSD